MAVLLGMAADSHAREQREGGKKREREREIAANTCGLARGPPMHNLFQLHGLALLGLYWIVWLTCSHVQLPCSCSVRSRQDHQDRAVPAPMSEHRSIAFLGAVRLLCCGNVCAGC